MDSYPSFIYSLSRIQPQKIYDMLEKEIAFQLDNAGFEIKRAKRIADSIYDLLTIILKRVKQTPNGPLPPIGCDYVKVIALCPALKEAIKAPESHVSKTNNDKLISESLNELKEIEKFIPQFSPKSRKTIPQSQGIIIEKVNSTIKKFNKINDNIKLWESNVKVKSIPEKELNISQQISNILKSFDFLFIELIYLSVNKNIKASPKQQEQLNFWSKQIIVLSRNLIKIKKDNHKEIIKTIQQILLQLPNLSTILGSIQPFVSDSNEFANATLELCKSMQSLNGIEMNFVVSPINKIINKFERSYMDMNESFDDLLAIAKKVLVNTKEHVKIYGKNAIGTFNSLSSFLQDKKIEREDKALLVSSIIIYSLSILPDIYSSSDNLISLAKIIGLITKSVFNETRELVSQIFKFISVNFEFFDENMLNEINLYLLTIRNIIDFDVESKNFIQVQQRFFCALIPLPLSLGKLIESCSDKNIKENLSDILKQIIQLSDRYSKWVAQFYLAIFSSTQIISQTISNIATFPISVVLLLGGKGEFQNTLKILSETQILMKTTPNILLYDFKDIITMVNNISKISNIRDKVIQLLSVNGNVLDQIFKQAIDIFCSLLSKIPNFVTSLPSLCSFNEQSMFYSTIVGYLLKSSELLMESQKNIQKLDEKTICYLSTPFIYILMCDLFIKNQSNSNLTFIPGMKSLRTYYDIVWPVAITKAAGENHPEAAHFQKCIPSIIKTLESLISNAFDLLRPSLLSTELGGVQEMKKLNAKIFSLQSPTLKHFAHVIIFTMRNSTNPETKIAINQWFNATQSKILSIDEAISKLSNALNQLLTAKTTDRSSLIEGFASLSVSLAVHENNFGKTIGPIVSRLHTKLIEIIHHTLELNHNSSAQFMKIYGNISQIHGLYPISRLKQSEIDDYLAKILKNYFSLNTIRTKEKLTKTNDTLEVISALNHLKGFFQVFPQNEISIREILELVIRNKVTKDQLNEYILKFAEKLLQIIPDQFSKLSDLHDMDDICDLVYDKSEIFSEEVNKILLLVKEKSKDNTIFADSLKTMLLNFSDVIILVMHSLIISGITFSPISATFTNCFSQLALDFGEFIEKTLSISNSSKDISPELRRINRKMTNQFDSLINIVENQEIYSLEANSEFEVIKNMLFANLSTLVVQVARLNALVSVALVPEMYKSHYKDIIQNINDITNQLKSSVSKVRSKAVGKTSTEIGSLMNELENKVNSVIQSTKKIDFNDIFPPKVLYLSVVDLCKVTLNMCKTGAALTDIVIIEPDKEAAGKVPGDYSVPQLPKVKSSPSEALQEINIAKRIVYKTTSNFKTLIETYSVASSELLDAIKSVRDATIKFIEKALIMAVVTVDSSSQVEQQTSIYSLVSALNDLQLATKNRLLRTPNFEQEMCDSIKMFDTTFEKCIKLADIASKIEIVVEDDSLDQVTKELNATSNAIELMTSKLKEFEEQVKRETEFQIEEESHIDVSNLEAASGTLAAYLISAANPIFSASAAIVRRAKDITNKLLLSNKKIENERGLIKAAQELSEASELIIICAESLVNGNEADAEYKVIAASRIIKATIAALVSQVLLKGGDPEGIMNKLVKEVSQNADSVISRSKAIVQEKLDQEENARPKKGNVMIRKLNMQQRINEQLKLLQQEERNLYQFRHK